MSKALQDVSAERKRQISQECRTHEGDDEHTDGALAVAAACYALSASGWSKRSLLEAWPWHSSWFKPSDKRRELVKAAALLLAEIERLDRKQDREVAQS